MSSQSIIHIEILFNTLDIDMAKVKYLGETVDLPHPDIEDHDLLNVFLDPTGNRVAIWQNASPS